jgi:hypothetical protein
MGKRELEQPPAALAGVHAGGHGHGVGVVVDLNEVLVTDVQTLEILAHDHEIDIVEAAAGDEGTCRTQIRVQLEFLAQTHVRGAIAAAGRRLQGSFQCESRAADARDRDRRQRIARALDSLEACHLRVPFERRAERVENLERGVYDLGSDPIAGDQGGGYGLLGGHGNSRGEGRGVRILELV